MNHADFVNAYRAGLLAVEVDLSKAMHVRDLMHKSRAESLAHELAKGCGCLLPVVGVVLSFTWVWWAFLVGFVGAGIVSKATQKTAAEYVRNACLVDHAFYAAMLHNEVIRVSAVR